MMKSYDVIYIGNYTKDMIISSVGTKYVDGCAVYCASHAARLAKADERVIEKLLERDRNLHERQV